MKVYYIANARLPNEKAHGIQLAKMCEAFVAAGIDLELIVPARGVHHETLENFYGLKHKIKIIKLATLNLWPATRFGFNLGAVTFALAYFFYLLKEKLAGRTGIIYTIDLDQFSFALIPLLGWPYFFETHAIKRKNFLYKYFFKKANGIITINNWIKKDLLGKFGMPKDKILVFPNGIDVEMFSSKNSQKEARQKLNLDINVKIILYVGRFYDWKGLNILTQAAEFLPDQYLFYLVGGTSSQFQDIIGAKSVPGNIVCAGERGYQEIPLWIAAADVVLVLGTKANEYSYYQTSPMKIFEYMAARRPIVASRTPAVREVLSESEAVFYDPDDARSLAITIRSVMDNQPKLAAVVEQAYQKVLQYAWLNRAQTIVNFISQKS